MSSWKEKHPLLRRQQICSEHITYLEESEVTYEFAIREAIRDTAKNILNCKRVEELKENMRISKGWLYKQEKRCNIGGRYNAYPGENVLSVWGRKTVNRKGIKRGCSDGNLRLQHKENLL